jgi:hypothetical protein
MNLYIYILLLIIVSIYVVLKEANSRENLDISK